MTLAMAGLGQGEPQICCSPKYVELAENWEGVSLDVERTEICIGRGLELSGGGAQA